MRAVASGVPACAARFPSSASAFSESRNWTLVWTAISCASAWFAAWTSVRNCCSITASTPTPPSSTTTTKSRYTLTNWTRSDRRTKGSMASTPKITAYFDPDALRDEVDILHLSLPWTTPHLSKVTSRTRVSMRVHYTTLAARMVTPRDPKERNQGWEVISKTLG